jgi:hypothetical protein
MATTTRAAVFLMRLLPFLLIAALAAPPAVAQAARPAGETVERTVTTDAHGNQVVTERTFRDGVLVRAVIRTYSPRGRLLRKIREAFTGNPPRLLERETTVYNPRGQAIRKDKIHFNPAGAAVKVETFEVTYRGNRRLEVEREFRLIGGVLVEVARTERTIETQGGRRYVVTREYELRDGRLVLASTEREPYEERRRDEKDERDERDERDEEDEGDERDEGSEKDDDSSSD